MEAHLPFPPLSPSQVHIQRLVLALLCVTCVEVFLPGLMAVMAYRDTRLSAEVRAGVVPLLAFRNVGRDWSGSWSRASHPASVSLPP